jgi:hypothetical protein
MLLLALLPILSEPSPPYRWRFQIQETYKKGDKVTTHFISSGDYPPEGYSQPLTLKFQTTQLQHTFGGNAPFLCFIFDQTKPYCKKGAKWVEEYGGCPYWTCTIHWFIKATENPPQGNTLNAYYDGSDFCLHIPDPWDSKWETGVIAKGYSPGASSYPSTTFKI